jgi:hypothetical protein
MDKFSTADKPSHDLSEIVVNGQIGNQITISVLRDYFPQAVSRRES